MYIVRKFNRRLPDYHVLRLTFKRQECFPKQEHFRKHRILPLSSASLLQDDRGKPLRLDLFRMVSRKHSRIIFPHSKQNYSSYVGCNRKRSYHHNTRRPRRDIDAHVPSNLARFMSSSASKMDENHGDASSRYYSSVYEHDEQINSLNISKISEDQSSESDLEDRDNPWIEMLRMELSIVVEEILEYQSDVGNKSIRSKFSKESRKLQKRKRKRKMMMHTDQQSILSSMNEIEKQGTFMPYNSTDNNFSYDSHDKNDFIGGKSVTSERKSENVTNMLNFRSIENNTIPHNNNALIVQSEKNHCQHMHQTNPHDIENEDNDFVKEVTEVYDQERMINLTNFLNSLSMNDGNASTNTSNNDNLKFTNDEEPQLPSNGEQQDKYTLVYPEMKLDTSEATGYFDHHNSTSDKCSSESSFYDQKLLDILPVPVSLAEQTTLECGSTLIESKAVNNDTAIQEHQDLRYDDSSSSLSEALILLRIMSQDDWLCFDNNEISSFWDDTTYDHVGDEQTSSGEVHEYNRETSLSSEVFHDSHDDDHDVKLDPSSNVSTIDSILKYAQQGRLILSTNDYNTILASLAINPELMPDEIMNRMLQIYTQMRDLCRVMDYDHINNNIPPNERRTAMSVEPDATTYEILLLALTRRLHALTTARNLISEDLLSVQNSKKSTSLQNPLQWTPELFEAVAQLCEEDRCKSVELAKSLLIKLEAFVERDDFGSKQGAAIRRPGEKPRISKRVFCSLLKVMKYDNEMEEGVRILTMAVMASKNRYIDQNIDEIYQEMLRWPTQNRKGQTCDNTYVLDKILQILLRYINKTHSPSFSVWKQFIVTAAKGAHQNEARWCLVAQALVGMLGSDHFWPDNLMLKHGIDAGAALCDSDLVVELISRAVARELTSIHERDAPPDHLSRQSLQLSFQNVIKALEVCIKMNDIQGCQAIINSVDSIREFELPSNMRSLCVLGLTAFAKAGNVELVDKLISYMVENGINPGDESYATVIKAAGISGDFEQAKLLLEVMESGEVGDMRPGSKCYEAFLVACVENEMWDDVFAACAKMDEVGIVLSEISNFCQLRATYKTAGRAKAITFLETLLLKNSPMGRDVHMLALNMVLLDKVTQEDTFYTTSNTDEVEALRLHLIKDRGGAMCKSLEKASKDLIRSLQIANFEDKRQSSSAILFEDIKRRRQTAWRQVMEALMVYDKSKFDTLVTSDENKNSTELDAHT